MTVKASFCAPREKSYFCFQITQFLSVELIDPAFFHQFFQRSVIAELFDSAGEIFRQRSPLS
jgi:hypothetical protein